MDKYIENTTLANALDEQILKCANEMWSAIEALPNTGFSSRTAALDAVDGVAEMAKRLRKLCEVRAVVYG